MASPVFSLSLARPCMTSRISTVTAALMAPGEVPLFIALAIDSVMVALGTVVSGLMIRVSSARGEPLRMQAST